LFVSVKSTGRPQSLGLVCAVHAQQKADIKINTVLAGREENRIVKTAAKRYGMDVLDASHVILKIVMQPEVLITGEY